MSLKTSDYIQQLYTVQDTENMAFVDCVNFGCGQYLQNPYDHTCKVRQSAMR